MLTLRSAQRTTVARNDLALNRARPPMIFDPLA